MLVYDKNNKEEDKYFIKFDIGKNKDGRDATLKLSTHLAIFGDTRYGKSNLMRYLMIQAIKLQQEEEFDIILLDFKNEMDEYFIDYNIEIATEENKIYQILNSIPGKIAKKEKKYLIFIDEIGALFFKGFPNKKEQGNCIMSILRGAGRGIHFVICTQYMFNIPISIRSQCWCHIIFNYGMTKANVSSAFGKTDIVFDMPPGVCKIKERKIIHNTNIYVPLISVGDIEREVGRYKIIAKKSPTNNPFPYLSISQQRYLILFLEEKDGYNFSQLTMYFKANKVPLPTSKKQYSIKADLLKMGVISETAKDSRKYLINKEMVSSHCTSENHCEDSKKVIDFANYKRS